MANMDMEASVRESFAICSDVPKSVRDGMARQRTTGDWVWFVASYICLAFVIN